MGEKTQKTSKAKELVGWGSGGRQEVVLKEQRDRDAGHHGAEDEGIIPHGRSVPSVKIHLGSFFVGGEVAKLHSLANNLNIASHVTLWLFGNNYIHITDSK